MVPLPIEIEELSIFIPIALVEVEVLDLLIKDIFLPCPIYPTLTHDSYRSTIIIGAITQLALNMKVGYEVRTSLSYERISKTLEAIT